MTWELSNDLTDYKVRFSLVVDHHVNSLSVGFDFLCELRFLPYQKSFHRMNVDGKSLLDVASWGKEDTPLNSYRDNDFFLAIDWAAAVSSPHDKALRMLPGYRFAYNIFRWRKQLYGSLKV